MTKSDCPYSPCKWMQKMEKSNNLFAFIEENFPLDDVLDNVEEASKGLLKCTCCVFGNALLKLRDNEDYKPTRIKRIKKSLNTFKANIISLSHQCKIRLNHLIHHSSHI
nr:hypothetical protein [uncultured Bacteroides sp.]